MDFLENCFRIHLNYLKYVLQEIERNWMIKEVILVKTNAYLRDAASSTRQER